MSSVEDKVCEICYTDEKEIVICWNSHQTCMTCYLGMWEMRGGQQKCGFCREKMFEWGDDPTKDPILGIRVGEYPRHNPINDLTFASLLADLRARDITRDQFNERIQPFLEDTLLPDLDAIDTRNLYQWAWMADDSGMSLVEADHPELANITREQSGRMLDLIDRRRMFTSCEANDDDGDGITRRFRVPLLHANNRLWPFGSMCSCQNGRIRGLNRLNPTHEDYLFLQTHEFYEDQLAYSPNFEKEADHYRYVGEFGPKVKGDNFVNGLPSWIPFPKRDCENNPAGAPRCGHCKCAGHTAEWTQRDAPGNPRRSHCPKGNSKDKYRKERVDKFVIKCL